MMKILITAGMHALAQKLARSLKDEEVMFGDNLSIPDLLVRQGKYVQIPYATHPTFAHELLKLGLDLGIDLIVPLKKEEIVQLSSCKQLFEEYGIQVVAPASDLLPEMNYILNPGREVDPQILLNGHWLFDPVRPGLDPHISGLCLASDSGADFLFCCLEK